MDDGADTQHPCCRTSELAGRERARLEDAPSTLGRTTGDGARCTRNSRILSGEGNTVLVAYRARDPTFEIFRRTSLRPRRSLHRHRSDRFCIVLVVLTDKREHGMIVSAASCRQSASGPFFVHTGSNAMTEIPELTRKHFARAIPARVRRRLMLGRFESGDDVVALRRFVGLSQTKFARAMGISVHTLRNWEQGRRRPKGRDRSAAHRGTASSDHSREPQVRRMKRIPSRQSGLTRTSLNVEADENLAYARLSSSTFRLNGAGFRVPTTSSGGSRRNRPRVDASHFLAPEFIVRAAR